uniref:GIY-YIG domain-containing protein n=1 Tax=Morchella importuna TaxID=1174673 RepID=A0A650AFI0_9PEZI|nr:hypothetical protein [Morchella importuna]QGN66664.1 hypothetical protein [Morchella importuna]
MSKDRENLAHYIGSSTNIKRRYNRHQSNLNSKEARNSQASPKFYNYIRKYGLESLEFGCLLETKDYVVIFSGFDLSPEEISLLKSLTQLDLLITEQYGPPFSFLFIFFKNFKNEKGPPFHIFFKKKNMKRAPPFHFFFKKNEKFLDSYGLSLNISPYVGTRESSLLSAETRNKMSDSHLGKYSTISEEKWAIVRAKAKEAWANEPSNSKRREAVSAHHGIAAPFRGLHLSFGGCFRNLRYR